MSFSFSPNANGVGAINGSPAFAPTPLALGLNVSHQAAWGIDDFVRCFQEFV